MDTLGEYRHRWSGDEIWAMRRWLVLLFALFASAGASRSLAQTVDFHFNGMWYQPSLAGHGFNLTLQPGDSGQFVFVTFFTYDDAGEANFYSGSVEVEQWLLGETLSLPMFQSANGGFSAPRAIDFDNDTEFAEVGTLTLRLHNCQRGVVEYQLFERSTETQISQNFAIEKLIGVPIEQCQRAQVGSITRVTQIAALNLDQYQYYLYVPTNYQPGVELPLLIAWHGAAGPGRAPAQAQAIRDLWSTVAEEQGLIVLAQTGTSPNGSWIPSNTATVLTQLLTEVSDSYALDRSRIYGWGFSAGGHVMHSIALANTSVFAAYAVNAGALNAVVGRGALPQVARQIPVSILIGLNDSLLDEVRGDRDAFVSSGWAEGSSLFYREFTGGHSVPGDQPSEHWSHLSTFSLPANRPPTLKSWPPIRLIDQR